MREDIRECWIGERRDGRNGEGIGERRGRRERMEK